MSLLLAAFSGHATYADTHMMHGHKTHQHASSSKANETTPVNINQADATELQTLKGLGVKKSAAIIAYRQANGSFKSVADLAKVKGIGTKMVARLQEKNPGRMTINNN